METGEVLVDANAELYHRDPRQTGRFRHRISFEVFFPERDEVGTVISSTIKKDPVKSEKDSLIEIYRKLRPGDPPTVDTATQLFTGNVFRPPQVRLLARRSYEVQHQAVRSKPMPPSSTTGRLRRKISSPPSSYLLKLRKGIWALWMTSITSGNRRVRAVGELLENQFRIGLVRMERAIKEKMSVYQEMSTAMPHDSGERQTGYGRDPRVLWLQPTLAVHGSDESTIRDHPQTPPFGSWTRRSFSRTRRV